MGKKQCLRAWYFFFFNTFLLWKFSNTHKTREDGSVLRFNNCHTKPVLSQLYSFWFIETNPGHYVIFFINSSVCVCGKYVTHKFTLKIMVPYFYQIFSDQIPPVILLFLEFQLKRCPFDGCWAGSLYLLILLKYSWFYSAVFMSAVQQSDPVRHIFTFKFYFSFIYGCTGSLLWGTGFL